MRVLLFIYNYDQSVGGHYHSLNSISRELGNSFDVGIVTIGTNKSPVFEGNPFFKQHIEYSGPLNYLIFFRNLKRLINQYSPDIIHCFDSKSLSLITPVIFFKKVKLVLNKCGGRNPLSSSYVYSENIIFFSLENFEWFSKSPYYHKANLYLIPNRVSKIDLSDHESSLPLKDNSKFNIVRISRISFEYKITMKLSINLAAFCNKYRPTRLFLIGRVSDEKILESLKEYAQEIGVELIVISDSRANIASNMLYLSDLVVGTGRSTMEAMSLSIPVLCPASNVELPVKITESNLEIFFKMNFSERVVVSGQIIEDNIVAVRDLLENPAVYQQSCEASYRMFHEHFDVKNVSDKYGNVYKRAETKRNLYLLTKNFSYIVRDIFN